MSTPPAESGAPDRSAPEPPPDPAPSTLTGGPGPDDSARPSTDPPQQVIGTVPEPPNRFAGPAPSVPGYDIEGELGRGGMGVVYKARQTRLKRPVALKMILAGEFASPEALRRLGVEAEAVARLNHPNIVQIYCTGEVNRLPYLALEYVGGGTLQDRLACGPLPVAEAVRLVECLARAVAAAHAMGIVHRDLKPGNVLLTADGTPKVADFGLAKDLSCDGQTATGSVVGTPAYMAPEQAEGRVKAIGPHTDVWALGAILYALLTGRPPFRGESAQHTLMLVQAQDPESLRKLRPDVPAAVEAVCLKCLEKKPSKRYPSALALADDLVRVREGKLSTGTTGSQYRGPMVATLGVIALTGIAITVGVALWPSSQPQPMPVPPVEPLLTSNPADERQRPARPEGEQMPPDRDMPTRPIQSNPSPHPEESEGAELLKIGQAAFRTCAQCHKPERLSAKEPDLGVPWLGDSEWVVGAKAAPERLARIILFGVKRKAEERYGGCPPERSLTDTEVAGLIRFLRTFSGRPLDPGDWERWQFRPSDVAEIRQQERRGFKPYTFAELEAIPRRANDKRDRK